MRFKLVSLTPLHIGEGNENKLYPFEYWKEENKLRIGDFEKFVDVILSEKNYKNNLEKLLKLFKENTRNGQRVLSFLEILRSFGLEEKKEEFVKGEISLSKEFLNSFPVIKKEISLFIRHNNSLYIPGSSRKGAIRSSLIQKILKKEDSKLNLLYEKKDKKEISEEIENIKFDFNDKYNISVNDIEMSNWRSNLSMIKRIGMGRRGAKLNFIETIEIKEEDNIFVDIKTKIDFKELKETINDFYLNAIKRILEMECVKRENEVYLSLKKIEEEMEKTKENSFYLQVGYGGNYFTKSIGRLILEFANEKNLDSLYLSRLRKKFNFGFCKRRNKKIYLDPFPRTFGVNEKNEQLGWLRFIKCDEG
ncbi:MAG: type III-A CRISPR-associated RAMP protein Csm5 [Candidatus Pacearchaeota archaeon]